MYTWNTGKHAQNLVNLTWYLTNTQTKNKQHSVSQMKWEKINFIAELHINYIENDSRYFYSTGTYDLSTFELEKIAICSFEIVNEAGTWSKYFWFSWFDAISMEISTSHSTHLVLTLSHSSYRFIMSGHVLYDSCEHSATLSFNLIYFSIHSSISSIDNKTESIFQWNKETRFRHSERAGKKAMF